MNIVGRYFDVATGRGTNGSRSGAAAIEEADRLVHAGRSTRTVRAYLRGEDIPAPQRGTSWVAPVPRRVSCQRRGRERRPGIRRPSRRATSRAGPDDPDEGDPGEPGRLHELTVGGAA